VTQVLEFIGTPWRKNRKSGGEVSNLSNLEILAQE
jgi:hypothetical protein